MDDLSSVYAHCLTQHLETEIQLKTAQEGSPNKPGTSTAPSFEKPQGMVPDREFKAFWRC